MKKLQLENRGRALGDLVLEYAWRERSVSRPDIARALGMARSTVSEITAGLLDRGLLKEAGTGPSTGGRCPVLLEFQDDAAVIVGVELGGSHISVMVTDLRGRCLAWVDEDHPVREDPEGTLTRLIDLVDQTLDEGNAAGAPLLGIGVAVPSPVDPSYPDRLSEVVMPAWRGHRAVERIRARFEVPVRVDNDANLGALAEGWWGAGKGVADFVYIKVGTGLGAGHVIGGQVYPGSTGVAGEIGHLAVEPDGRPCVCGNRGCLEAHVGTKALLERAAALAPGFPDSPLARGTLSLVAMIDAVNEGDPLATLVVTEAGERLGIAVAGVLNLLNPAVVIVGGGIARAGDRLLDPLRKAMTSRTLVRSAAASQIRVSALGPRAVALGAATSVLAAALAEPDMLPDPARATV